MADASNSSVDIALAAQSIVNDLIEGDIARRLTSVRQLSDKQFLGTLYLCRNINVHISFEIVVEEKGKFLFFPVRKNRPLSIANTQLRLQVVPEPSNDAEEVPAVGARSIRVDFILPSFVSFRGAHTLALVGPNATTGVFLISFKTDGRISLIKEGDDRPVDLKGNKLEDNHARYFAEMFEFLVQWSQHSEDGITVGFDTLKIGAQTSFGSLVNQIIEAYQSLLPYRRPTDTLIEKASKRCSVPRVYALPALPPAYRISGMEADIVITIDDKANLLTRKTRDRGQQYEVKAKMVDGDNARMLLTWRMADFLLDGPTFSRIMRALRDKKVVEKFFYSTGEQNRQRQQLKVGSKKFLRFTEEDFELFFESVGSPGSALIARISRNFESKFDRDVLMVTGFLAGVGLKLFYVVDFKIKDVITVSSPILVAYQVSGSDWVSNHNAYRDTSSRMDYKDVAGDLVDFFQRLFRIMRSTSKFVH